MWFPIATFDYRKLIFFQIHSGQSNMVCCKIPKKSFRDIPICAEKFEISQPWSLRLLFELQAYSVKLWRPAGSVPYLSKTQVGIESRNIQQGCVQKKVCITAIKMFLLCWCSGSWTYDTHMFMIWIQKQNRKNKWKQNDVPPHAIGHVRQALSWPTDLKCRGTKALGDSPKIGGSYAIYLKWWSSSI